MRRTGRSRIGTALLALVLVSGGIWGSNLGTGTDPAGAATLAYGFSTQQVFSGLSLPTAFQFAPDGRVFVAEKRGVVKVFDNLSDTSATVFADLTTEVYDYTDRGLLSLTVDPAWPARPYVYVLYAYDHVLGDPSPAPKYRDACGTSPDGVDNGDCVASARLSRLTANVAGGDPNHLAPGGEKVLVEDWCQQFPIHINGTVAFGTDGALYASHGSAASAHFTDYGQTGTPTNPCGDAPVPVGGTQVIPTAEGGALRSQDPQTPSDPYTLDGTVIRVDPDTGAGLPGNPLFASTDANARRILTYGLRMPFRFAPRAGANELWIGDVGEEGYEEIDRVPVSGPVTNGGWPCYEAESVNADYSPLDICRNLVAQGPAAVLHPYWQYQHHQPAFSGDTCSTGSSSVSGIAFYGGGNYPVRYDGAMFVADYARECIFVMLPGAGGLPDPTKVENLATGLGGTTDLHTGPGGDLYVNDLIGGSISRLAYSGANRPPTPRITADRTNGPAPLTVKFDATASVDPDGDPLRYSWDLNGDGQYGDSTSATPSRRYPNPGAVTVRLRATDDKGLSATTTQVITSGNTEPLVVIATPTTDTRFSVGSQIGFAALAYDPEDGWLPASSYQWSLVLQHCPGTCHQHPSGTFTGVTSGSFVGPAHEYPAHLDLTLTVTDTAGLASSRTVSIYPDVSTVTVLSDPPNLLVDARGAALTPFTRQLITGDRLSLSATDQDFWIFPYEFDGWSDGGAPAHDIVVNADTTVTARFSVRRLVVPDRVVTEPATTGTVNVPVLLDRAAHTVVTAKYTVKTGTAGAADVTAATGTLTIPAGADRAQIPVQVKADAVAEPTETFSVSIDTPTKAFVDRPTGTVQVLDDDTVPPLYTFTSQFDAGWAPLMTRAAAKLGVPVSELPRMGAGLLRYLGALGGPNPAHLTPPPPGEFRYASSYATTGERDAITTDAAKFGVTGAELHTLGAQLLTYLALLGG